MSAGLRFAGTGRRFGEQPALVDLDLDCPAGAMTCLIGPNGAGKSTALALAAGLLAPSVGRIVFESAEVDPATPPASTGYLPQHSAFHPSLSVAEVVAFTRAARGATGADLRRMLGVTGLEEVRKRSVGELSGGWVRRLGLLSALLGSPRLLLLDEPFVGLDPETHDRLLDHLGARLESGATLVLASHDFEVLDPFGPRVAVLDEGRLLSIVDLPADGRGSSRAVYRRALGAEPPAADRGLDPVFPPTLRRNVGNA